MTLPELSIKRHVLAYMLSGVLVLLGIISYQRIGVDRFPRIEFPIVSVITTMIGSNPDIVDSSLTNIIENKVNSIPGIEHIQSKSSPGVSVVTITFNLDKDIDIAFNEVQAKINQVLKLLPDDADPPRVMKVETESSPIMWLALQGDRTQQQLNTYAENVIKKKLETINGVGEIRIGGRRERTIRVNLNPDLMSAYGITAQDVSNAFKREHVQLPGGFLVGKSTEDMIKLDLEYHSVQELKSLIVAYREKAPVLLSDIAQVEDSLADFRQLARFNREISTGLGIVKIAGTNTVKIIEEVKKRLEEDIRPDLPPGMTIRIASDASMFILGMIHSLLEHLVLGTLLAALVVLVFLRNLHSTFIIGLAIPVSLLGAVAVIYFGGFTFNSLTLLAMLLLIGVVVDDAIVVLENIYRHREQEDPDAMTSAVNGTNQVVFAVMASTLTLVSIFAPVIFLGGIIGMFFKSFAVVVTFGVIVSWFVSMTLTPMLCSRYLKVETEHGKLYQFFNNAFLKLDRFYRNSLALALSHRWKVLGLTLLICAGSFFFFSAVGKSFVPKEDEGRFMIFFRTPLGSNIDYTNTRLKEIEKVLASHPDTIASYFTAIGLGATGQANKGMAFIRLTPKESRSIHQTAIINTVRRELFAIPGVKAFAAPVPIVGGQRGSPLQFVLKGHNITEVARQSERLKEKLAEFPELGNIDMQLNLNLPQKSLVVDRIRASQLGLNAKEVATAVNNLLGGSNVAKYNDHPGDGERYDIRIKVAEREGTPYGLDSLYLRTKTGSMVRADTIASFKNELGPAVIPRFDLQYAASFFGNPSIPLGEAVELIKKEAKEVLPLGYTISFIGQAEEFKKTSSYMTFTFLLALVLVYMVLASQFNSFLQPFIIMFAQPLAMIGGVALLWATGHTLNIYSMIGMVLLVGLVAKNSILLVDITNQYRTKSPDINKALKEACPVRLRPVLMTSFTVIFALLPTALGFGEGSDSNAPLAVAVIGGMISSTLLTFYVVPVVYSLSEHFIERLEGEGLKALFSSQFNRAKSRNL